MMLWLAILACAPPEYGTGPVVYDDPVPHEGDAWLFSHERINRIDITLDEDALEILRAEAVLRGVPWER